MAYQVTAGRFVGHTQKLAWLRDLRRRAAGHKPPAAVIGREVGIGKTRLADPLAAVVEEQGWGLRPLLGNW